MKLSAEQIQRLTDLDFKWAAAVTRSWENIRTDTLVALPNEITSQGTLPSEFALSSSPRLGGNMMSNTGSIWTKSHLHFSNRYYLFLSWPSDNFKSWPHEAICRRDPDGFGREGWQNVVTKLKDRYLWDKDSLKSGTVPQKDPWEPRKENEGFNAAT